VLRVHPEISTTNMKKKTMVQAGLVSPRLSLEATQEASEAPRSDDSNDGVSSLFSPSPLLRCWPCCPLLLLLAICGRGGTGKAAPRKEQRRRREKERIGRQVTIQVLKEKT
jgi:hypothetical protein